MAHYQNRTSNGVPYRNFVFAADTEVSAQKESEKGNFWDTATNVLGSIFQKPPVTINQAPAPETDYTPLYVALGFAAILILVHILKR